MNKVEVEVETVQQHNKVTGLQGLLNLKKKRSRDMSCG